MYIEHYIDSMRTCSNIRMCGKFKYRKSLFSTFSLMSKGLNALYKMDSICICSMFSPDIKSADIPMC